MRLVSSKNLGPFPVVSIPLTSAPAHSAPFDVADYTKHSYQVNVSGVTVDTNLAFYIYAKNDDTLPPKWQKIAGYVIKQGTNEQGILYFDCWNFVSAKCSIVGTFAGAEISVVEKHNA